jgi:hypothetical protein
MSFIYLIRISFDITMEGNSPGRAGSPPKIACNDRRIIGILNIHNIEDIILVSHAIIIKSIKD